MGEIYISCDEWRRKDGYYDTILIDFGQHMPKKGEIINIQSKEKEGVYEITNIEYNLDYSETLESVTLVVEKV